MTSGNTGRATQSPASEKGTEEKSIKVTSRELRKLLQDQEYRCALTGRHLDPDSASCDHIIPVSKGGEHTIENVQIVHKDVNSAKGTLPQEEFFRICVEVTKMFYERRDEVRGLSSHFVEGATGDLDQLLCSQII